jgi:hypothetical protein
VNGFEFNPSRLHECASCGDVILDGFVFRLTPFEVICLRDYVECVTCLWSAGFYDQRQGTP